MFVSVLESPLAASVSDGASSEFVTTFQPGAGVGVAGFGFEFGDASISVDTDSKVILTVAIGISAPLLTAYDVRMQLWKVCFSSVGPVAPLRSMSSAVVSLVSKLEINFAEVWATGKVIVRVERGFEPGREGPLGFVAARPQENEVIWMY